MTASAPAQRIRLWRGEFAGSRWEMAGRVPCAPLLPHVLRIMGYDEQAPRPQGQRQFPEPFVVLIIEFGPPIAVSLCGDARRTVRSAGGFVAGLGDEFAITEHTGRQRGVQVDLTPTGARRLFGVPARELADRVVALRDLLPEAQVRTLSERLAEAPDWSARLDLVEALLLRRILGSALDTRRVDHALARIAASGGRLRVDALARELGHSRKHVAALFHDQVGVGPKLLLQLVRFQQVMRRARGASALRWAELALEHGYSDQAHLAHEVRRFTGLTPEQARRELPSVEDLLAG